MMRMRLIVVIAIVAAVWQSGPRQAHACTCRAADAEVARQRLAANDSTIIVQGTAESVVSTYSGLELVTLRVERMYRGPRAGNIRFMQSGEEGLDGICRFASRDIGARYVLTIQPPRETGESVMSYCDSWSTTQGTDPTFAAYQAELERLSPPWVPAPDSASTVTLTAREDNTNRALWAAAAVTAGGMAIVAVSAGARRWLR